MWKLRRALSVGCQLTCETWVPTVLITAWASGRTDHQVLASTVLCRNLLNQASLQICPAWTENVINTLLKIRKGLGNETSELLHRRWTKPAAEPGARQEAEMVKPQSCGRACSPPTHLAQGSRVRPNKLLNVGQAYVQSHAKNISAACHKILVVAQRRRSPNAGDAICKFSNGDSMQ